MMSRSVHNNRAFSLVELIVVIGIIMVLIGVLFPVVQRVRGYGTRTQCASNLRQIGVAFHSYAAENRGVVPRYSHDYFDREPLWLGVIPLNLGAKADFQWSDLPGMKVLQCPNHPVEKIPSAYVLNAFAFETAPAWTGAPARPISKVKSPSAVLWMLEASERFGDTRYGYDGIYYEPYHVVRSPEQLDVRLAPRRHVGNVSNVLYLDGHVTTIKRADIRLEAFDDGVRQR